jgi:hypothetical protein
VLFAAVLALLQLLMQSTRPAAQAPTGRFSVPFRGCASSDQQHIIEAPRGASKNVSIRRNDAEKLAYYESADGNRLLAPRNWYCVGAGGSSGAALFLSPKPISGDLSGLHGLDGAAIELMHFNSEAGGRYEVAQIIARVFPEHKTSAALTLKQMEFTVPSGPYPKDILRYRGRRIVEYTTPAQTEGLGNFDSWLMKNDLAIVGAAMLILHQPNLVGDPPNVILLSVRLSPDMADLAPAMVAYAEHDFGEFSK